MASQQTGSGVSLFSSTPSQPTIPTTVTPTSAPAKGVSLFGAGSPSAATPTPTESTQEQSYSLFGAKPVAPPKVVPAPTQPLGQKISSVEDTIGNNIGGAEASFSGGLVKGLGNLVNLIGGNIARGLNKIMPIVPQTNSDGTPAFSESATLGQESENQTKALADKMGTNPTVENVSQGIGEFTGEKAIPFYLGGEAVEATRIPALVGGMLKDVPIVGRFIAPVVANTIKNLAGFSAADQTDTSSHWNQFVSDVKNSALFGTAGAIPAPLLSIPATGIAGYASARLSGASQAQALASGIILAGMHSTGLLGENKVPTAAEALAQTTQEARATINEHSTIQLDENSSADDIDKAFKQAAMQTHPDVGGTAKAFSAVSWARDFLKEQVSAGNPDLPVAPNIAHPLALDGQTELTPENTPPVTYTTPPQAPQSTQANLPTLPDTFPVSTPSGRVLNSPADLEDYIKAGNPPVFTPYVPKGGLPQTAPGETLPTPIPLEPSPHGNAPLTEIAPSPVPNIPIQAPKTAPPPENLPIAPVESTQITPQPTPVAPVSQTTSTTKPTEQEGNVKVSTPGENKNEDKPVETGNKTSGVAKSIEAKAIEAKLTSEYPEKAGYNSSTFKVESEKTAELINSGIDKALAVVRGEEPSDIKAGALISGMELYAKSHPEMAGEIMQALANSNLATKISEGASETSFARMREPDSATARLNELKKQKIAKAGGEEKAKTSKKNITSKLKQETTKTNLSKEDLKWDKFLESIKC